MAAATDQLLIGRMYRAWNAGDVPALAEIFDNDAEVRPALSAFLGSTVYRGRDGVAQWYAETYEPWARLHAEPRRYIDAGDNRTLVVVALHARVPGGHVDVDGEIAHVFTVCDGRIVRLDGFENPAAAFAAAGLRQ